MAEPDWFLKPDPLAEPEYELVWPTPDPVSVSPPRPRRGRSPEYDRPAIRAVAQELAEQAKAKGHIADALMGFTQDVAQECKHRRPGIFVSPPDKNGRSAPLERIVRDIYYDTKKLIRVAGLK